MKQRFSLIRYPLIAAFAFAFDQGIKMLIRKAPYGAPVVRLDPVAEIVHYGNTGAAFSLFSGNTGMIALASIGLMILLAVYMMRSLRLTVGSKTALALLVGGGCDNLADRIFAGEVTDYIRLLFIRFPVFNLADILITLSVVYIAYELMTGKLDRLPGE